MVKNNSCSDGTPENYSSRNNETINADEEVIVRYFLSMQIVIIMMMMMMVVVVSAPILQVIKCTDITAVKTDQGRDRE